LPVQRGRNPVTLLRHNCKRGEEKKPKPNQETMFSSQEGQNRIAVSFHWGVTDSGKGKEGKRASRLLGGWSATRGNKKKQQERAGTVEN